MLCIDVGGTSSRFAFFNQKTKKLTKITVISTKNLIKFKSIFYEYKKNARKICVSLAGIILNNKIIDAPNISKDLILFLKQQKNISFINDANAFALGLTTKYDFNSLVGITVGTGIGAGIIINKKLVIGNKGLAGEIGRINIFNKNIEQQTSSKFFNRTVKDVFKLAVKNNAFAIKKLNRFSKNINSVIDLIKFTLNPEKIFLGGGIIDSRSLLNIKKEAITVKNSFKYNLLGAGIYCSKKEISLSYN